jgi:hypothetical protein
MISDAATIFKNLIIVALILLANPPIPFLHILTTSVITNENEPRRSGQTCFFS